MRDRGASQRQIGVDAEAPIECSGGPKPIQDMGTRTVQPGAGRRLEGRKGDPEMSRLGILAALAVCFVAGFLIAGLWSSPRDTSPLAQICARVDYVSSLQEHLKDDASEEMRSELNTLVEQCRTALRDRAEEND
jgi:hypothetical protein